MTDLICCTFNTTQINKKAQYYRNCKTCVGPSGELSICLGCVAKCHDGHELGPELLDSNCSTNSTVLSSSPPESSSHEDELDVLSENSQIHVQPKYSVYDDEDDLIIFAKHKYETESDDEQPEKRKRQRKQATPVQPTGHDSDMSTFNFQRAIANLENKNKAAAAAFAESETGAGRKGGQGKGTTGAGRGGGAPKKEKDPNAPKGAMVSYMLFSNEIRAQIKGNTNLTMVEVSKVIAAKWKLLTPAEKQPYEEMAQEDRERYMLEMHEYNLRKGNITA